MPKIRIAALDGSLRNFGIAKLDYDTDTGDLTVAELVLTKTEKSKVKSVRSSSDNLARAQVLAESIRDNLSDCAFVFAEVPSGGQDFKAVMAFGIVVGLYASIPAPLIEVSPSETKMAAVGTKTASKAEMIEWATGLYPAAPWRTTKRNGVMVATQDNEHLADAVAIAYAGVRTAQFRQAATMFRLANK
jgi:Holliday junction resolvasome RuvABC endonuclease subunit